MERNKLFYDSAFAFCYSAASNYVNNDILFHFLNFKFPPPTIKFGGPRHVSLMPLP